MPLEKVKRWISREHRTLRKEVMEAFRNHGIEIKGRDLLGYSKEELLKLKDALSELEAKHGMTLREIMNDATKYGFAPFGWNIDGLVRNRLTEKKLPKILYEYIKGLAKQEAQRILGIAPETVGLKEIEYNGKKIPLTEAALARFLSEHGLKHAKELRNRVAESVIKMRSLEGRKEAEAKGERRVSLEEIEEGIRMRSLEDKKEEALAIIERAKKAGVKGVRVGEHRISLEEIEEGIRNGDIYAYTDALRKIEEAIQKSERGKRRATSKQVGRFISAWMPKSREPAPIVSKDLVHILEKAKEIAIDLEKAYRRISAYDASHVGHANAAEAIYSALHENPEEVLKGMVEALNEVIHGNPIARIEKYEIRGPEFVFSTIEKRIGQTLRKYIRDLSEKAAEKPEAVIKEMKEKRAYQLGRELASILLDMRGLGHIHLRSVRD